MFISTREMLSQVGSRSTDQATIENHYGPLENLEELFEEPTLGPVLAQLGAEALSDKALRLLAVRLAEKDRASRS